MNAVTSEVICVECRALSVADVPVEYIRDDVAFEHPSEIRASDFISFKLECSCDPDPTYHNVRHVHRDKLPQRGESA